MILFDLRVIYPKQGNPSFEFVIMTAAKDIAEKIRFDHLLGNRILG